MKHLTATALSAAILMASGVALAQTSGSSGTGASGTTGTTSGTTSGMSSGTTDTTTSGTGTSAGTSSVGSGTSGTAGTAATTTTGTSAGMSQLSEAEVENALMAAGYTEVSGISVTADEFTATATKDGQNYQIEGRQSEKAENATDVEEDEIRAQLEEKGYTDVTNIEKTGNSATAEATKDGEQVDLHADLANGLIWQAKQGS